MFEIKASYNCFHFLYISPLSHSSFDCKVKHAFNFWYSDEKLIPFRVSKKLGCEFNLDLLLLSDGTMHHYVLIRSLKSLVHKVRKRVLRIDNHLCRNCFHVCSSKARYEKHISCCQEKKPAIVRMPAENKNFFTFRKLQARWFAPVVGFFDLESIIEPVTTCRNDPQLSDSRFFEIHKPCSYALLFIAQGQEEPFHFEGERGPGVMQQFVESLEKMAKTIYFKKQQNRYFDGIPTIARTNVENCWICESPLDQSIENPTVLDHCHFTGEFLGWAHNECNINRKLLNFTPVFAHNLSNYDLHHVILALQGSNMRNRVTIVPTTDEKYIALEIGVFIKMRLDKNKKERPVYENIRLLDSFRFMPSSLDSLAKNLPAEAFKLLVQNFSDWPESAVDKLKQKSFFPYSYIDNFNKLEESKLPPRSLWTNSLHQFEVNVTQEEYEHAVEVFKIFECSTVGEYYDIYLQTDVFLLAAIVVCFRKVCYETYGLDCCQDYTASNLSGDAMLKTCKAPIELLTQREHLDMVENLIRGGISSVYSKRLAVANNKYLDNFDATNPSTFIIMIDAKNLYGGVMEKFCLPLNDFDYFDQVWDSEIEPELINKILETADDSDVGYIVEVDLEYPDDLHNLHSDFPLAPTKDKIDAYWLSDYQRELLEQMQVNAPPPNKKLIQTLFPKTKYTLHYQTLKLYVELGVKVTKVHRALAFKQSKWLAPYVQLNTQKRKEAQNKFEENI